MANLNGYKDLIVYKKAFQLSMDIFEISKSFPTEEKYSLTDQIRRSSRSVGAQIAEGWPKRRYIKLFVSKLIDSQGEACETSHWLDVSLAANYISVEKHKELNDICVEVQKMLDSMIKTPEKFCK
ncbi:MAG TPA: four helix bundle protein [Bacteroidales bacterium]|nr:four helix bundle protein [Bacteroidales bacterium]